MIDFKAFDFHIHTKRTLSDNKELDFDVERLREYVAQLGLKAIAITNHNAFDLNQYEDIKEKLSDLDVIVFPGVEISLEKAHMLVISPDECVQEFSKQCEKISRDVEDQSFSLSLDGFHDIFGESLKDYLLIPHYKKDPSMAMDTISKIKTKIIAGEVQNPKKFQLMKKDANEKLCPVMFSDIRMGKLCDKEREPAPKITYISIDEISIPMIKIALTDKNKVALTKSGEDKFIVDRNLTTASIGLNVVLGKRSSGKTYLLNRLADIYGDDDIYYIKQFEIVNECADDKFESLIKSQFNKISEEYLSGIRKLTEIVCDDDVDEESISADIDKYLSSLKRFAEESALRDTYSKAALFNEGKFEAPDDTLGENLLKSLNLLVDNKEYSDDLSKNVDIFKAVFLGTLLKYRESKKQISLKNTADDIISTTKERLARKSSANQIKDIGLYKIARSIIINKRFDELIRDLREESNLKRLEASYGRFKVVVSKKSFRNVSDLQDYIGTKEPKQEVFKDYYDIPHKFVKKLKNNQNFSKPNLIYRTLLKIEIEPVKDDNSSISKGERAEYVLMQKLDQAQNFHLFLFDEPEPSFDNPFIGSELIETLKHLSDDLTIFLVTHNSTLGASINPNCILYTAEEAGCYRLYSGSLTSRELCSSDGRKLDVSDVLVNTLESSYEHYSQRKELYGITED